MSKLPDPMKRRGILYGKGFPAQVLREYGDLCLQEGKPNDAVEFFDQACYKEGLRRKRRIGAEEVDLFLFSPAVELVCRRRNAPRIRGSSAGRP
jgi:hypothetical protein